MEDFGIRRTVTFVIAALVVAAVAWVIGDMGILGFSMRGDDLPPAPELSPAVVGMGLELYQSNCMTCHGINGEGQRGWETPLPDGTRLAPPHNSEGHSWRHGDRVLYRIVRDGGPVVEASGATSAMPAFADALTPEQIRAVLTYIKTFWTDDQRAFQAKESVAHPFP